MEGKGKEQMRDNVCRSMVLFGGPSGVKRSCSPTESVEVEREEEEELELTLGLSMNGKFGVDPARKNLKRSFSALNLELGLECSADNESEQRARGVVIGGHAPLARTSSMPFDIDWRPREESERLKNVVDARVARDGLQLWHLSHLLSGTGATVARTTTAESSSSAHQFLGQTSTQRVPAAPPAHQFPAAINGQMQQRNTLTDMPHVFTTACGPNHDKIEGFLYRFKNGERDKIVCVCHGMFFTPEEFVRHGGGNNCDSPYLHY